jgi:hypothetical protein
MSENGRTCITLQGKKFEVPALRVGEATLIASGKLLKIAGIIDEEWYEKKLDFRPDYLIERIRQWDVKPDLFTFSQDLPDTTPKYPYTIECGNLAVAHIKSYEDWWTNKITQVSRKNVRRAVKRGVSCRKAVFDDELVNGIVRLYNESPIRQGRKFWHYGKDVTSARDENSTFLDRADFIGAYHDNELIGFIKTVYVGACGKIMQILTSNKHQDKRPANALIAKAVEICADRGIDYFVYGNYVYDGNVNSSLIELKRRMGFEMAPFPIYYVPLTEWGKAALKLNLHHGIKGVIPRSLSQRLRDVRARWYANHVRQPGKASG